MKLKTYNIPLPIYNACVRLTGTNRRKSCSGCIYIIKSVFDREMGNGGFNSTAFLAWAKRNDIIITDNGKRTKKARITGSATNCVCIKKNLNEFEPAQIEEMDMLPL